MTEQTTVATTAATSAASKADGKVVKAKKKKAVRQVPRGNAYIQATYNNTIVSVTDLNGAVLGWASAGASGFKGPKRPLRMPLAW